MKYTYARLPSACGLFGAKSSPQHIIPASLRFLCPRLAAALLTLLLFTLALNAPQTFAAIIFQQNFDTNAVGSVPSNLSPQSWGSQNIFAVVASPARAGGRSMRLKLQYVDNESYRAEVIAQNPGVKYQFGTEYWVGYSEYLNNWASDTKAESVSQGHASNPSSTNCGAGSCNYMGQIAPGNTYNFRVHLPTGCQSGGNAALPPTVAFTTNVVSGQWVDWVLHFKNATNNTGYYNIWRNGTKVYSVTNTVTAQVLWALCCTPRPANQHHYTPKWGIYKWDWKVAPSTVSSREMFLDEIKIWEGAGGSYAAVAPGGGAPATPDAPASLTLNGVTSAKVDLNWPDVANETGYGIQRKVGTGVFTQLVNKAVNSTFHSDTTVSPSTTYTYQIRATNASGNSAYTASLPVTTPTAGATVTVSATDANASESGLATGTFTFTRTGSTAAALTVNYTVGGTASGGADYTSLGTTVTFAAGSATTNKTVTPIQDTAVEGNQTVIVTLATGTGYTIGTPSAGTVNIADNDFLFEAELLPATGSSGDVISVFAEPTGPASGGTNSLLTSGALNDFITYTVNVPVAGTYNVTVAGVKYTSRATCELYVNGSATQLGSDIVLYDASGSYVYTLFNQGNVALNAGNNTLKFQVSAQGAGGGWKLSFDYIRVTQ